MLMAKREPPDYSRGEEVKDMGRGVQVGTASAAAMVSGHGGPRLVSACPNPGSLSRTDPLVRLNAICPYYTMFPLEFPWGVLSRARPDEWVLDPFCGRGTTLFAARLRGVGSVGIDASPVAVALAQSKLVAPSPRAVTQRCEVLLRSGYQPTAVPTGDFWRWAYHPDTLLELCRVREQLLAAGSDATTIALRSLLMGVLHGPLRKGASTYLSNQMPRTYASKPGSAVRFWQERSMQPPRVDLLDVVRRRAQFSLAQVPPVAPGDVRLGDSAWEIGRLRRRFSWLVTSPPYYGMRTYRPDQWLRGWFLGGDPQVDYSVEGQIRQTSGLDGFVEDLGAVWRAAAGRCLPGAHLVVRFGALPGMKLDPGAILRRSVEGARSGWMINVIMPVGDPPSWTRQAAQFGAAGDYVKEVDCYATLTI